MTDGPLEIQSGRTQQDPVSGVRGGVRRGSGFPPNDSTGSEVVSVSLEPHGELAKSRRVAGNCAWSTAIAIDCGRSLSASTSPSPRNHSSPFPRSLLFQTVHYFQISVYRLGNAHLPSPTLCFFCCFCFFCFFCFPSHFSSSRNRTHAGYCLAFSLCLFLWVPF